MARRAVFALVCLVLLGALAGCGKRGALVPPEARVPAPIADLRVEQKGEQFVISWSSPAREEGGGVLRNLAGFRLVRREVLPPAEDCEQCPEAWRLVRDVDLEYLKDIVLQGERFFFTDGDLAAGKTYQYKVVSLSRDGAVSRDSNKPRRTRIEPPPAPVLAAESTPGAVELSWDAAPLPAGMALAGYNIYRRPSHAPFHLTPVNPAPLPDRRYEDRRLDPQVSYTYVVRTVSMVNGEVVESRPSNEVAATLERPDPSQERER